MNKGTLLAFIGHDASKQTIDSLIETTQNLEAHLFLVVLAVAPPLYGYSTGFPYGGGAYADAWRQELDATGKALDDRTNEIEKIVQKAGISSDVISEFCDIGLVEAAVRRHANVADLIIMTGEDGLNDVMKDHVFNAGLYHSPVGILYGMKALEVLSNCSHAMIAWDASVPAANAVHKALPTLKETKSVTICTIDPVASETGVGEEPGADLAAWLARHGCNVTLRQYPSGGLKTSKALLKCAAEVGADLIVMGAYEHSKMKQKYLGGTTKAMLAQTDFPLFLSN